MDPGNCNVARNALSVLHTDEQLLKQRLSALQIEAAVSVLHTDEQLNFDD